MKPRPLFWHPFRTRLSRYFLIWLAATLVSCEKCDIYPERPDAQTVIFGRVTDEKTGLPVAGLELKLIGTKRFVYLTYTPILSTSSTDQDGKYQIELKVPKEISEVNVFPQIFYPSKFDTVYSYYKVNGSQMIPCCPASIGQYTEYNFQLTPRQ